MKRTTRISLKKNLAYCIGAGMIASVGVGYTSAQNVVQNGNFTANAVAFQSYYGYSAVNGPITNWTAFGSGNAGLNGTATGVGNTFGPSNPGTNTFAFQQHGVGGLLQSITLLSNTVYQIAFDAAARNGNNTAPLEVEVGDTNQVYFNSGSLAGSGAAFAHYAYTFSTPSTFAGTPSIQLINLSASGDNTVDFANIFVGVAPLSPPTISTQPVNKSVYLGGTAAITTVVQGNPTPLFQWYHNSVAISGDTNESLIISNIQESDAGSYVLYATNSVGSTNTVTATLSAQPLPVSSQYAMTVLANNPFSYWRFNDGEATNAYDYVGGNTAYDTNYLHNGGSSPSAISAGPQPPLFLGFESTNTAPLMDGQYQGYATAVSLMNNRSNYTIMGWFKINPSKYPFSTDPLTNPQGYTSLFGQEWCGELGFVYDNSQTSYTGPILYFYPGANQTGKTIEITNGWSVGEWNFLAATVDSTSGLATMFLNGIPVQGISGPDTVNGSASTSFLFSIGKDVSYFPSGGFDNGFFPGTIDEVAAFDHALPVSVIQAIYQASQSFKVSIQPQAGAYIVNWPVGHLETSTNISGPWQSVAGAVSPLTVTNNFGVQYYRAVNP